MVGSLRARLVRHAPVLLLALSACAGTARPPVADRRPYEVKADAGTRSDEYYWLRDDTRTNRDVLA